MIELIILGFLSYNHPFTLYDIKKGMERSTEYFASTSQGAIHPALVKLEKNGYVTSKEEVKNNRTKKLYRITDAGRERFSVLMRQDFGPDKYKSTQLLKMFFFNELTKNERLESINTHIKNFRDMHQDLVTIREEGNLRLEENGLSLESCKPAKYENDALEFGLAYTSFAIKWFEDYFIRIEEES
ncbi:Transcriptional regulator PadR-like family protein [Clostridium sp. C105KSO15]|nr:Transcriptional regulator PadR-like family protein [Clostridium sp. C105KSO15]